MASARARFEALIQGYVDGLGDLDLRAGLGTPGTRLLIRGETRDAGEAYGSVGAEAFLGAIFEGLGRFLDGWGVAWGQVAVSPLGAAVVESGYGVVGAAVAGSILTLTLDPVYSDDRLYAHAHVVGLGGPQSYATDARAAASVAFSFYAGGGGPLALLGRTVVALIVGAR